jgi:hypothetical protein
MCHYLLYWKLYQYYSVYLFVCVVHISATAWLANLLLLAGKGCMISARILKKLHLKVYLWHPFLSVGDTSEN